MAATAPQRRSPFSDAALADSARRLAAVRCSQSDADPALIHRCAEFFLDHGQYEKTVRLFAVAGECAKALDLCMMHSIPLSEDMAERLCPELGERGAETEELRNSLLLKVSARTALHQS